MSAHLDSPAFTDILTDADDVSGERDDTVAKAHHVLISGHRYTRRRQDTNRAKRARQQARALPSVMVEREWVAVWIELIDASVYTPPGTPRAGRILREGYMDASIRLPVIRDLGRALLPHASAPAMRRPMAAADVVESVPA